MLTVGKKLYKKNILPHFWMLQVRASSGGPIQGNPPLVGGGLEQVLVLFCLPALHGSLHSE